jgi:1-acyl-sn-glycerol-3-phosphate acyltransferase
VDRRHEETPLPRRVEWRFNFFTGYFRRWMTKSFHAVRVAKEGLPLDTGNRPVLVVLNHPSWWDPLMGFVLSRLLPGYKHYAPMEAKALRQYPIFEPLGVYGVEPTAEGAIAFLKTTSAILSQPMHAVWLTAQGRFSDPRERPVELRPGVGHLLRRLNDVLVIPLALEYPFWQERYPEALAKFGTPIHIEHGRSRSVDEWVAVTSSALTATMDDLAALALARDVTKFETVAGGSTGVGGVYGLWRRFVALITGKRYSSSHEESVRLAEGPS